MLGRRVISRGAPVALACSAALASAGPAQASDAGLRSVVKKGVPGIVRSQAKILNGIAAADQSHRYGPLLRALVAQDRTLSTLRSKVAAASPSSSTGARARTDIVDGLGLIVASNQTLIRAVRAKASGHTLPQAQLRAAVAADKRGNVDLSKGAKLLGI